jgi:hypothetical protein
MPPIERATLFTDRPTPVLERARAASQAPDRAQRQPVPDVLAEARKVKRLRILRIRLGFPLNDLERRVEPERRVNVRASLADQPGLMGRLEWC